MKGNMKSKLLAAVVGLTLLTGCPSTNPALTPVAQVTIAYQGYDTVLKALIAAQAAGYISPALKTQITPYLNSASKALAQAATDAQAGNTSALQTDLDDLQVAQAALSGFVTTAKATTQPTTQP